MEIDSFIVLPRCMVVRQELCRALLAKPASFACTFLAQGASLKPMQVAACVLDGVLQIDTTEIGFLSALGTKIGYTHAAKIVRAHAYAVHKSMKPALAYAKAKFTAGRAVFKARKALRVAAGIRKSQKKILAQLDAGVAKRVVGTKAKVHTFLAAVAKESRLLVAKQQSLVRIKAHNKQQRALIRAIEATLATPLPSQVRVAAPVKVERDLWFTNVGHIAEDASLGVCSLAPARYVRAFNCVVAHSTNATLLFSKDRATSFGPGWRAVPGQLLELTLIESMAAAYKLLPSATFVEDTYAALSSGVDALDVFKEAIKTCDQVQERMSGKPAVIHGFTTFIQKCKDTLANKICTATGAIGEAFFSPLIKMLRKAFDDCIMQFVPQIASARAQIENFWQCAVSWSQNLVSKLDSAIRALQCSAFVAAGIMIVGGILYFVETLLSSLGLLSGTGTLIGLFVGGLLAIYCTGTSLFTGPASQIRHIIVSISKSLYAAPTMMSGGVTAHSASAIFGVPLAIVETLGSGLMHMSLDSLTYVGKFGTAVDNIRKGVTTMRQFLGWIIEKIAYAFDAVTGKQAAFFRELSSLVQVDVQQWIVDSQNFLLEAEIAPEGDRVIVDTVLGLLNKGTTIQRLLCNSKQGTSFNYARLVADLVKRLNEVFKEFTKSGRRTLYRKVPFWLYLYGEAGCGKSIFANNYKNLLASYLGTTADNTYFKNARDSFWSKYRQQKIVVVDDLSSVETMPSMESEFIQLVTTMPYGLNMAAVDEKGAEFNSSVIITTSNFFQAPTTAKIHDASAYNRRRHAVVQVRRKEGTTYDPATPYNSSEARFVNTNDQTPIGDWISMEEMSSNIMDKLDAHTATQEAEYQFYMSTSRSSHDVFDIVRDQVQKDSMWFSHSCLMVTPALGTECSKRFIFVDGKVIEFDPLSMKGTLLKTTTRSDGQVEVYGRWYDPKDMENQALMKYDSFRDLLHQWSVNGIVKQFISQLMEGPSHVDSFKTLNQAALLSHRELFDSLSMAERAILRLVQKRIDDEKARPEMKLVDRAIKLGVHTYLTDAYDWVAANGGKIFLILAAICLILFFGSACINLLRTIFVGGTGTSVGAAGMGAAMAKMSIHSQVFKSGSDDTSFASRNIRRVYRPASLNLHSAQAPIERAENEHALNAIVRLDMADGGMISGLRFKARSLCLTYHQAMTITPGSLVRISYMNNAGAFQAPLDHYWDPNSDGQSPNLIRFANTEICVYKHPQLSSLPAAMQSLFVKDVQTLPKMMKFKGSVIKLAMDSSQYLAGEQMANPNEPILHMFDGVVSMSTHEQVIDNYVWGGDYSNKLPRSWVGNYPSFKEDCGAILVAKTAEGYKVIGMHVAGDQLPNGSYYSVAALLPDYDSMTSTHSGPKSLTLEAGKETPGVSKVGWVRIDELPRAPKKTMYETVDEEYMVPSPVETKQPAILSPDDKRLVGTDFEGYDPLRQATAKCESPMLDLNPTILHEVVEEMCERWFDCSPNLSLLSDEEMINGNDEEEFVDCVITSTSEGYPYILERKAGERGKARYFEQDPELAEGKLRLKAGTSVHRDMEFLSKSIYSEVPELWCVEVPKDERLPARKIQTPKTRTFSVLPMPYNLLLKKFTGRLVSFLQGNRHRLPCAVGINPYSREWTQLYDRLAAKSPVALNGDYASFDGLLNFQMYDIIARLINKCYGNDVHAQARYNLIIAMYGRYSICGSQVYEVRAGLPSGCAITVVMNSIFNEILIRYVYKLSVTGVERNHFHLYVSLVVYGDDNLIAVDPRIASGILADYNADGTPNIVSQFNGPIIQRELAKVGVKITDGSDKSSPDFLFKPLQSLDFLKRGFKRLEDGRVLAPLELTSIFSPLHTVIPEQGSTLLALFKNVGVSLRELYLHQDRVMYDNVRSFFVEKGDVWHTIPTWNECRDFHQKQYSGWAPWTPQSFMEIPLPKSNKDFMLNQGGRAGVCIVADQVIVVGPGWKNPDPAKYFCVDFTQYGGGSESVLKLKVDVPEGSGKLPTEAWVRKFRSPKTNFLPMLQRLRKEGVIIAFKDEAPFLTAWIAAISYCIGVGMCAVDILPMYTLSGGAHPQMVRSYFENISFLKLAKTPGVWVA